MRKASVIDELLFIQTRRDGGSKDTEVTDETVIAYRLLLYVAEAMQTGYAKFLIIFLKVSFIRFYS